MNGETITFRVVKEPYGWAVRLDEGMMTAFCSRDEAIRHARSCVATLRRRGQFADVAIEAVALRAPPTVRRQPRFLWF